MKVTIKGDNIKSFDINVKDTTLSERQEVNRELHKMQTGESNIFDVSVDVMRMVTDMTDDQINMLDNDQIYAAAMDISNIVNKKKLK